VKIYQPILSICEKKDEIYYILRDRNKFNEPDFKPDAIFIEWSFSEQYILILETDTVYAVKHKSIVGETLCRDIQESIKAIIGEYL